jgi:hypothetical protein
MSLDATTLLDNARTLLQRFDPATAGIWPRATALLTRQALELTLDELWKRRAPGLERCSARAQLLCLPSYVRDQELARQVSYAWSGLSRACHQHAYELPPTSTELGYWMDTVEQLVANCAEETHDAARGRGRESSGMDRGHATAGKGLT